MKITIVILDNDREFGQDLADIISELDENFYRDIDTEITKIIAIPTSKPSEALDAMKNNDVALLSLDIELDGSVRGDDEYEKLFFDGIAVPCIVVSAVVDTEEREEQVRKRGVSEIIHITRGETDVAQRLARTICLVLGNRDRKFTQLKNYVDLFRLHKKIMSHDGTEMSVQEWLNGVIDDKYAPNNESEIIKKIIRECVHQSRLNQDHGFGFHRN